MDLCSSLQSQKAYLTVSGMCVLVCVQVFQQELPEAVQETWDHLTEEPNRVPESNWRLASPKSLVDNLCHTMYCLFSECFDAETQQDCEYDSRKMFKGQLLSSILKVVEIMHFLGHIFSRAAVIL